MVNFKNAEKDPCAFADALNDLSEKVLCRGKRRDNGKWIEGFLFMGFGKTYICPESTAAYVFDGDLCLGGFIEVDPATVGRYIGIKAKGDKKIFEGDRLETIFSRVDGECQEGWLVADLDDRQSMADLECVHEVKIAGNIYDDAEPNESADGIDDQMQIPF